MLNNYPFFQHEMILRDHLALDRTVLANKRTFLAYLRTFIGMLSAGVAMVKLIDGSLLTNIVGYTFILASPIILVVGIVRYTNVYKKLRLLWQGNSEDKS